MHRVAILVLCLVLVFSSTALAGTYILNGRDFDGWVATGSPSDNLNGFTLCAATTGVVEVETYEEASGVMTGINVDVYPEVTTVALVPSDTYRLWITRWTSHTTGLLRRVLAAAR